MLETESTDQSTEFRCDTCGRMTDRVTRVVVDAGYNRANARPLYNCPECYEAKLRQRLGEAAGQES